MKKLIAALLCMTMATTMFMGCAKEEPKTEEPEVNTDAEEEAPEEEAVDAKVSVFWYDESDVYLGTVRDALNKELDALGVEYDNQFAANTQSTQLDQIKTAISAGSNLLVVNVVTSGAPDVAEDILAAAGDIPVIFFNRAIGTDAPEAGHMQGKMIGDYVVANYDTIDINGDGNISYAMFMGDIANVEAIYRTQYGVEDADAVITAAGKPALVYFDAANADKYQVDQAGAWSAKAAKEYMETNFVTYNEDAGNMIELIICNNDGMAEGAVAALQEKGYNVDGAHVVPVFGVDATDNAKSLIAEGAMAGTIKQDAEGMAAAIAQTVDAVAGGAAMADVFAGMTDARFSVAADCTTKLFVAYAPYTGE